MIYLRCCHACVIRFVSYTLVQQIVLFESSFDSLICSCVVVKLPYISMLYDHRSANLCAHNWQHLPGSNQRGRCTSTVSSSTKSGNNFSTQLSWKLSRHIGHCITSPISSRSQTKQHASGVDGSCAARCEVVHIFNSLKMCIGTRGRSCLLRRMMQPASG